jgi:hypothetical protein
LGLALEPFTPIPYRPPHHRRFHRLAARIRDEEAKLVAYLGRIADDLERRPRASW